MRETPRLALFQALLLLTAHDTAMAEQPRVALSTHSEGGNLANTISVEFAPSQCQTLSSAFSGKVQSFKPSWGTYCEAFDLPDCQTKDGRLSDIVYPGIEDLSTKKTEKGSTWQAEMKSYKCNHDCEHKASDLENALAASYIALDKAQNEASQCATGK